jgi:hypothetical protein
MESFLAQTKSAFERLLLDNTKKGA